MAWFHFQPKKTRDFTERAASYNEKYGDYDYANDSRILDATFERCLLEATGDLSGKKVLVVGSNSGYEINILANHFPSASFAAVDISDKALEKIAENLPSVAITHADMERLPLGDKEFDVYINCRSIHSTNVEILSALKEAIRVTDGRIVISISNGYLVEGKIVEGMYDYDRGIIDQGKSSQIAENLEQSLNKEGYSVNRLASEAELFITGIKD